jgi:hypothetical protein
MSGLGWRTRLPRVASVLCVLVTFLSLFAALYAPAAHAARKGVLWVRVIDTKTNKGIEGVEVGIKNTTFKALTDKNGEVGFELEEGKYNVSLMKIGFYNSIYPNVDIAAGKQTRIECECIAGDCSQQFYFGIGGVNIVGKKDLLPIQIETTHEISSAEIEHNLSTNLGDVLMLVPGVEKTDPPGLSKKSQVEFRGTGYMGVDEQTSALFGTKVIIDGVRISNNANLQTGTGTTYGGTSTVAGSGVDLRTIPADNIEKVEVVTGVPSVEYGDMTTGLVKVETKKEEQPNRLKVKSNPDTKEANLSGGFVPKNIGLSYNLNYAISERDKRREGDEYSRYSGQVTVRNGLFGDKGSLLNKLFYTGVIDEIDLDPKDPLSIEQSNKDKTYLYGLTFNFKQSEKTKFFLGGSVQYTKRDSYYQKLVGADTRVLTDSEEEGTHEGVFSAGAYLSQIWTKGEELTVDGKATARRNFDMLGAGNSLLGGIEYTFDDNMGQGQIFDPLMPPNGQLGRRPLPFDASPALYTASLYAEDEIEGLLFKKSWTANVGVRYEMYRPEKINFGNIFGKGEFVESKNGSFVNPRIRLRFEVFKDTRVRMSWGKASKMPSMTTIYQGPEYLDVVEENISPPDSVPLISTYVYNFNNDRLVGYQNEKAELSLDQRFGSVAAVLTGFFSQSEKTPRPMSSPITIFRYHWDGWPDPNTRTVIDTIYTDNDKNFYENRGWSENWGVEGQFSTARIKALSTVFKVNASFVRNRWGADGTYMSSPRPIKALGGHVVYPYYSYTSGWAQKLIVNYSADWFFERVGLWTTFFVQQTLFDHSLDMDDPYRYAAAYYDPLTGDTVPLSPEASDSLGLTRTVDPLDVTVDKVPNDRFLFNINVTKSLSRGAELSLFVHNVSDDAAYYMNRYGYWTARNANIFYGLELSVVLDDLFKTKPKRREES